MKHSQWLSDSELVTACREGHGEAWDALVARYERLVYTVPLRYGLPRGEADDVFQTVWMALLKHLPTLKEPERIGAWLVTTARRECWERRRGADFERSRHVDPAHMPEPSDPFIAEASPEEVVARYDEHSRLHNALSRLQERCRQLLHYLYSDPEKQSYNEISTRLNMPVSSIGPTRARCLEKLRDLLSET